MEMMEEASGWSRPCLSSRNGESVRVTLIAKKNAQNETGGRCTFCTKSLHTLAFSRSVKESAPGSDYSTNDGETAIVEAKQGVSSC